jgi:alkylhydroperoxidase family enzyme
VSADGLPRLRLDELDGSLRDYLGPTVERLGYFGEFFQVAGHVPAALIQFMEYTKAVKTALSDAENELLALTVCATLGADYERIQHERLAKRLGFTPEWIAAAENRRGCDASALSEPQRELQRLALAATVRHGERCTGEIEVVARLLGPEKTVAALLQITRFMTIAVLCNALRLELPVKSVFESG